MHRLRFAGASFVGALCSLETRRSKQSGHELAWCRRPRPGRPRWLLPPLQCLEGETALRVSPCDGRHLPPLALTCALGMLLPRTRKHSEPAPHVRIRSTEAFLAPPTLPTGRATRLATPLSKVAMVQAVNKPGTGKNRMTDSGAFKGIVHAMHPVAYITPIHFLGPWVFA